jgi:hypothetical protein
MAFAMPSRSWPQAQVMATNLRGRPFRELVSYHAEGMSPEATTHALIGTIKRLPARLHAAINEWLDLFRPQGKSAALLNNDCAEVFLTVLERSSRFTSKHGVDPSNETLINLFQVVTLNFALHANQNSTRSRAHSGFFGRIFGR